MISFSLKGGIPLNTKLLLNLIIICFAIKSLKQKTNDSLLEENIKSIKSTTFTLFLLIMISVVNMFVRPLLLSVLLINLLEAIPLQKNGKEVLLNNELGLTLLQSLNTEDNAFFSPLSSTQTLLSVLKKDDLKKVLDIKEDGKSTR